MNYSCLENKDHGIAVAAGGIPEHAIIVAIVTGRVIVAVEGGDRYHFADGESDVTWC